MTDFTTATLQEVRAAQRLLDGLSTERGLVAVAHLDPSRLTTLWKSLNVFGWHFAELQTPFASIATLPENHSYQKLLVRLRELRSLKPSGSLAQTETGPVYFWSRVPLGLVSIPRFSGVPGGTPGRNSAVIPLGSLLVESTASSDACDDVHVTLLAACAIWASRIMRKASNLVSGSGKRKPKSNGCTTRRDGSVTTVAVEPARGSWITSQLMLKAAACANEAASVHLMQAATAAKELESLNIAVDLDVCNALNSFRESLERSIANVGQHMNSDDLAGDLDGMSPRGFAVGASHVSAALLLDAQSRC
jgi:hypothetical protein